MLGPTNQRQLDVGHRKGNRNGGCHLGGHKAIRDEA